VTADPPLSDGALQVTVALAPVPEPATPSGADGALAGVTADDADDAAADVPVVLLAVAENLYSVPLVRGEIEQLVPGETTVQVCAGDSGFPELSSAVTVYDDGVPPVLGAEIVIVAPPFPGVAVGVPGVPGSAIVHWAVSVLFAVTFEMLVDAFVVVAPSLQPAKVNPDLVGAAAVVKP
jgi:hypothetical protein